MIFVIVGYAQGKMAFVKETWKVEEENIFHGTVPEKQGQELTVMNDFNQWVRTIWNREEHPKDVVEAWLKNHPKGIIISDEIGNGIVPMEKEERLFRDFMGNVQIMIAKQSEEVYRVICGIGQKIK